MISRAMGKQSNDTGFRLRKMQLWGEKVNANQINFEWPTKEMLKNDLPADVRLDRIDLKRQSSSYLSHVRCTLSDQSSSPAF